MDDEKKLQTIYSHIVEHTSYDSRYYQAPNTLPYESRTAYGPLEYGTAICGGFSWRSICSVKSQGFPAGTSPVWDLERIICGTALWSVGNIGILIPPGIPELWLRNSGGILHVQRKKLLWIISAKRYSSTLWLFPNKMVHYYKWIGGGSLAGGLLQILWQAFCCLVAPCVENDNMSSACRASRLRPNARCG